MNTSKHVLVIEDHPLMADAVSASITACAPLAQIELAGSLGQALLMLRQSPKRYALLVTDLNLPDSQGMDTLKRLRQVYAQGQLLALSMIDDPQVHSQSAAHNAFFVSKAAEPAVFQVSLCNVLAAAGFAVTGDGHSPPSLPPAALHDGDAGWQKTYLGHTAKRMLRSGLQAGYAVKQGLDLLTQRQRNVLQEICMGHSNKMIARNLKMSQGTVSTHMKEIFRRMEVNNRTQACQKYMQWTFDSQAER
jgi:DNA-binding NarL/FixJ family response regulator